VNTAQLGMAILAGLHCCRINASQVKGVEYCYKRIIIDLLNDAYQKAAHQGAAHKGFMTLNPSNGSS
jgi:hypothetical protein